MKYSRQLLVIFSLLTIIIIKPTVIGAKEDFSLKNHSQALTKGYESKDRIDFNDDHYIKFIPASGNLSGNCLSFAIEVRWALHAISWDLYMAGPKQDNSTPPEYEDYWDDDWEFIKGQTTLQLGLPDYTATFIVNRSVDSDGFYWLIVYVNDETYSYNDYMVLMTGFWFDWNEEKCYLDGELPLLCLISLGILIIYSRKKKLK